MMQSVGSLWNILLVCIILVNYAVGSSSTSSDSESLTPEFEQLSISRQKQEVPAPTSNKSPVQSKMLDKTVHYTRSILNSFFYGEREENITKDEARTIKDDIIIECGDDDAYSSENSEKKD